MKRVLATLVCTPLLCIFGTVANAQSNAPLTLVIPYSAGGNVDTTARLVAPSLSKTLGQTVVVENKPGAGGMIAAEHVMRSGSKENTFFFTSNGPILHSPIIYNRPAYNWKNDFIPVGSVSFTPMVLLATNSAPFKTLDELKEAASKQPDFVSIATPGMGSTNHLMAELLQEQMDLKLNTIHYKGTAPATTDLLGGHVLLSFDQINVALPHIKQGNARALAVTPQERLPQLPDVPTFKELGVDIEAASFVGVFAATGTPESRVTQISEALKSVLSEKEVQNAFAELNAERSGEFVYNMATWADRESVVRSSRLMDEESDDLATLGLAAEPSRVIQTPRLQCAPVAFECKHYTTLTLPGHTPDTTHRIVIGRVVGVHIQDDALTPDGRLNIAKIKPLARLGYMDYSIVEETFEICLSEDTVSESTRRKMMGGA